MIQPSTLISEHGIIKEKNINVVPYLIFQNGCFSGSWMISFLLPLENSKLPSCYCQLIIENIIMENINSGYQRSVFDPRSALTSNELSHLPKSSNNQQASYRPSQPCSNISQMEGKAACYEKYRALLKSKGNHYNNGLRRHWHEENAHMQYILTTMGTSRQPNSHQRVNNDFEDRGIAEVSSNVKIEHAISPCDDLIPLNSSTPGCVRNLVSMQPNQMERSNFTNTLQSSMTSGSLSVNSYLQSSSSISARRDTSYTSNVNSVDSNKSYLSHVSGDVISNASLGNVMAPNALSFEAPPMSLSSLYHSSVPVANSVSPHSLVSQTSVRSSLVNSACSSPHSIPTNSINVEAPAENIDELLDFDLPEDLKSVNDDLFNCSAIDHGALDLSISKLSDATDDLLNDLDPPIHTSGHGHYPSLFSP